MSRPGLMLAADRPSGGGILLSLGLHGALVLAGVYAVLPPPVPTPAQPLPMAVRLLAQEAAPTPPRPLPQKPQPLPPVAPRTPVRPQPVAQPQTQTQSELPASALASSSAGAASDAPQVAPPGAAAPRPAPVHAPAEPLVEARFDADYLSNPKPPYPALARRRGETGTVLLRVRVGPEGDAQQVELKQSSGYPRLDQSALETVPRWRFVPARRGETPVAAWVLVPVVFALS